MSADTTPNSELVLSDADDLPHIDDVEFPPEAYETPDVDIGAVLTADDVAGKHRYLARARPDWRASMATVRNKGGPWYCKGCGGASLLGHRCSICGHDLAGDTTTQGRQQG